MQNHIFRHLNLVFDTVNAVQDRAAPDAHGVVEVTLYKNCPRG